MPSLVDRLRLELAPSNLRSELERIAKKHWRRLRRIDSQVVRLGPGTDARPWHGEPRARVLFSYILDPFLLDDPARIPYSHTHFWESWTMAQTLAELGCRVDAVSWTHGDFVPPSRDAYDMVIDVRTQLERWAPLLADDCLKVLHIDTAHYRFHNPAQQERLDTLAQRRGRRVRPQKMLPANRAIETADVATVLGNRFTQETYAFAGKPLLRVPISVPQTYPWIADRDFAAARRRFLWFGSGGLVHKGLDRVLEAFAGMPDLELVVCGPIRRERDFEREYFHELYRLENIRTLGWIDVAPEIFLPMARQCLGLLYPSCSEGGGGSVFTCMHAGMVPILNREVSVDLDPAYGVCLEEPTVEGIRAAARTFAARPVAELESQSRAAWEHARAHHTKETFRAGYRKVAESLLDGSWRRVAPPEPGPATPSISPAETLTGQSSADDGVAGG